MNGRHGARSAWWRVRSGAERIHRFLDIVIEVNPPSNIYYKCGMLILKGWCSSRYCYTDNDRGGRGYDDSVPEEVIKTATSGNTTTRSPTWSASLPRNQLIPPGGCSSISPVGAIFVPSPSKTGTNLLHPPPPPDRWTGQERLVASTVWS